VGHRPAPRGRAGRDGDRGRTTPAWPAPRVPSGTDHGGGIRPGRAVRLGPGLALPGVAAMWVEPVPDGYRARLRDVSAAESATFAAALEEVLSPLAQPRYIMPRLFLPARPDAARRSRLPSAA